MNVTIAGDRTVGGTARKRVSMRATSMVGHAQGVALGPEARPVPAVEPMPAITGPQGEEARAQFEALITDQLDGLYRSALRVTRNRFTAEDLVQDVMLKAWRSFHTFHAGTSIGAWLHRILMNTHFSHYRKQTREPEVTTHEEVGEFYLYDKARESTMMREAGNPETAVLDRVLDSEIRDALESLPLQFRSAVILADVQGFSHKEIGYILGIPVGTVMSRLYRGRHMLQRKLWDYAQNRHYVAGARTK